MKKKSCKKLAVLAGMIMMVLLCCTACSGETPESPKADFQGQQETEKSDFYAGADLQGSSQEKPEQEDSDYFAEADLQGSVVEIVDLSCRLLRLEKKMKERLWCRRLPVQKMRKI